MRAVFLDKDGTLIEDIPYNVNPDLIALKDGAVECLKVIKNLNYLIIIITNQSGVARGLFQESQLEVVRNKIKDILRDSGITLHGFYYCPHHPEGLVAGYALNCECRNPKPGMIKAAAKNFDITLSESWMIGDKLDDVEAGNRAGCKTILLDEKGEFKLKSTFTDNPNFTVRSLIEAAVIIDRENIRMKT